jgi:imidazoleglycerol-phosphate dehydratase
MSESLAESAGGSSGMDEGIQGSIQQDPQPSPQREASVERKTKETEVFVSLCLEGVGRTEISTGLPFFDHMLSQLAKHSGFDLSVRTKGDLAVDAHHSVEDTGIALGSALAKALGEKVGLARFGQAVVPLDEALLEAVIDLSGRPYLAYHVSLPEAASPLGSPGFDPQLAEEFWRAFVTNADITMHLVGRSGVNVHHVLEASFKASALALRRAVALDSVYAGKVPSTKGSL